jgi:predicted small lipoprotein YifL
MKRWVSIIWLALAVGTVLLPACGQKGSLYLPDRPARPPQQQNNQ